MNNMAQSDDNWLENASSFRNNLTPYYGFEEESKNNMDTESKSKENSHKNQDSFWAENVFGLYDQDFLFSTKTFRNESDCLSITPQDFNFETESSVKKTKDVIKENEKDLSESIGLGNKNILSVSAAQIRNERLYSNLTNDCSKNSQNTKHRSPITDMMDAEDIKSKTFVHASSVSPFGHNTSNLRTFVPKKNRLDYLKHLGNMPYLYMPREIEDLSEKEKAKKNEIRLNDNMQPMTEKQTKQMQSRMRAEKSRQNKQKEVQNIKDENDDLKKKIKQLSNDKESSVNRTYLCKKCGSKLGPDEFEVDLSKQKVHKTSCELSYLSHKISYPERFEIISSESDRYLSRNKSSKEYDISQVKWMFKYFIIFFITAIVLYNTNTTNSGNANGISSTEQSKLVNNLVHTSALDYLAEFSTFLDWNYPYEIHKERSPKQKLQDGNKIFNPFPTINDKKEEFNGKSKSAITFYENKEDVRSEESYELNLKSYNSYEEDTNSLSKKDSTKENVFKGAIFSSQDRNGYGYDKSLMKEFVGKKKKRTDVRYDKFEKFDKCKKPSPFFSITTGKSQETGNKGKVSDNTRVKGVNKDKKIQVQGHSKTQTCKIEQRISKEQNNIYIDKKKLRNQNKSQNAPFPSIFSTSKYIPKDKKFIYDGDHFKPSDKGKAIALNIDDHDLEYSKNPYLASKDETDFNEILNYNALNTENKFGIYEDNFFSDLISISGDVKAQETPAKINKMKSSNSTEINENEEVALNLANSINIHSQYTSDLTFQINTEESFISEERQSQRNSTTRETKNFTYIEIKEDFYSLDDFGSTSGEELLKSNKDLYTGCSDENSLFDSEKISLNLSVTRLTLGGNKITNL